MKDDKGKTGKIREAEKFVYLGRNQDLKEMLKLVQQLAKGTEPKRRDYWEEINPLTGRKNKESGMEYIKAGLTKPGIELPFIDEAAILGALAYPVRKIVPYTAKKIYDAAVLGKKGLKQAGEFAGDVNYAISTIKNLKKLPRTPARSSEAPKDIIKGVKPNNILNKYSPKKEFILKPNDDNTFTIVPFGDGLETFKAIPRYRMLDAITDKEKAAVIAWQKYSLGPELISGNISKGTQELIESLNTLSQKYLKENTPPLFRSGYVGSNNPNFTATSFGDYIAILSKSYDPKNIIYTHESGIPIFRISDILKGEREVLLGRNRNFSKIKDRPMKIYEGNTAYYSGAIPKPESLVDEIPWTTELSHIPFAEKSINIADDVKAFSRLGGKLNIISTKVPMYDWDLIGLQHNEFAKTLIDLDQLYKILGKYKTKYPDRPLKLYRTDRGYRAFDLGKEPLSREKYLEIASELETDPMYRGLLKDDYYPVRVSKKTSEDIVAAPIDYIGNKEVIDKAKEDIITRFHDASINRYGNWISRMNYNSSTLKNFLYDVGTIYNNDPQLAIKIIRQTPLAGILGGITYKNLIYGNKEKIKE
ncbi:MAG: hypothetical protein FJW56_06045 [Actinobacteria bacterium]|nr:hypothetical protein [Actinomycetota bacterium]